MACAPCGIEVAQWGQRSDKGCHCEFVASASLNSQPATLANHCGGFILRRWRDRRTTPADVAEVLADGGISVIRQHRRSQGGGSHRAGLKVLHLCVCPGRLSARGVRTICFRDGHGPRGRNPNGIGGNGRRRRHSVGIRHGPVGWNCPRTTGRCGRRRTGGGDSRVESARNHADSAATTA